MRSTARLVLPALLLSLVPVGATDLETEAKNIESMLMSPCCMTNTVAVHESGMSHQMRAEIREMLAAGRTEREIIDHYVGVHGPQILAMPAAEGFSLTPYLFPFLALLLACVALGLAMRRWRKADRVSTPSVTPPLPSGPYADRLQRELDRLD